MLGGLRTRWAWRAALRRVRKREVRPWHPDPAARRVLLVFPDGDAGRPAWKLIERLALPPDQFLAVLMGPDVGAVPVSFLTRLRPLAEKEVGRLSLPKRPVLREIWEFAPDVALDFAGPDDLAAALLVGASPAAFRIGPAAETLEPFFDLLVGPAGDHEAAAHALEGILAHLNPSVLPVPRQRP